MYILKNALRCIWRSKGRNILIGMITLVLAVSACLGLSIRQAAESAKANTLSGMTVTAAISYNRAGAMGDMGGGRGGKFDRGEFADMMAGVTPLTLAEYQKYATADSVEDFYYTLTVYVDGTDSFLPFSEDASSESGGSLSGSLEGEDGGFPQMPGGMMGGMTAAGEFTLVGYSSDSAMTDFVNGSASILAGGAMFEEGTDAYVCVISEELALYNGITVGDTVTVSCPALTTETYTLTVSGIYTSTAGDLAPSRFGMGQDPANQIYMSATALEKIVDASASLGEDTALKGALSATYVLADVEGYYAFSEEVRLMGLDDAYTVSSADITAFENSLTPLVTLSKMVGWFLAVILLIGGIVLVVLNIFLIRERKYEVGVLTAMGMKKWKVAVQFTCEILIVTMVAVILGAGIGAVSAVPVTNTLLQSQIDSQTAQQNQMNENFGRPGNMGGGMMGGERPSDLPSDMGGGKNPAFGGMLGGAAEYIAKVDSAMNLTVVLQMMGVGLLLTLVASGASVLFIMRYDPLKILANRD